MGRQPPWVLSMQAKTICRVVGMLLALFSLTMIPPVVVALIYQDGGARAFILSFFITLVTGLGLWLAFRGHREELRVRDGFLIVVLFWTVLSLFGALPFYAMSGLDISFTNAVFESFSGLTTTGATVLSNLDTIARTPCCLYTAPAPCQCCLGSRQWRHHRAGPR